MQDTSHEILPRREAPADSELAYRFKSSTFLLYEPYIKRCISQWPEPVIINPAPLRATTFAARLRDAVLRLRLYYCPTDIDYASFDGIYSQITVSHYDHSVVIGPKQRKGRAPGAVVSANRTPVGLNWLDSVYTEADIHACVQLLGKRLLSGPLTVQPISPDLQNALESSYDCAIQTDQQRTIIF